MGSIAALERLARVRLLDADPELGERLTAEEELAAAARSTMSAFTLAAGRWSPPVRGEGGDDLAFYVIGGLLMRSVSLGGHAGAELLAPGDLMCPSSEVGMESVDVETSWRVLEPAYLGVIDRDLWVRLASWPDISFALLNRVLEGSRSLTARLALVRLRQLETRLSELLWHLADRHGRVLRGGVVALPMRLSHSTLAELACARRPSVSAALKRLERRGVLERRRDGTFVLLGAAPAQLATRRLRPSPLDRGCRARVKDRQHADILEWRTCQPEYHSRPHALTTRCGAPKTAPPPANASHRRYPMPNHALPPSRPSSTRASRQHPVRPHSGRRRASNRGPSSGRSTLGRVACLTAVLFGLSGLVAYPAAAAPELSGGQYAAPRDGGLYRLLKTDGKQRHHMPAAAILKELGYDGKTVKCVPSIRMDPEDHANTASFGNANALKSDGKGGRIRVQDHRDALKEAVEEGRFRDAMELDIYNIKALFGGKYDAAIEQMLEEYERVKDALRYPGGSGLGGSGCEPQPGGGGVPDDEPSPAPAAPKITPAYQQIYGARAQATWTVTVAQDPQYDRTLMIDFGDGSSGRVYIPEGTGSTTVPVSHAYSNATWGGVQEEEQYTVTAQVAPLNAAPLMFMVGSPGQPTLSFSSPGSSPATATVHQC